MERLPAEVLMKVNHYLPLKDVPKFRLVSREFAAAATPRLFRQLVFHASNASLNRILAVATHPVFRKYVRELVWDAKFYDCNIQNIQSWESFTRGLVNIFNSSYEIENLPDEQDEEKQDRAATLLREYTLYKQKVNEESEIIRQFFAGSLAKCVFGRLANLKSLVIVYCNFTKRNEVILCAPATPRYPMLPRIKRSGTISRGEAIRDVDPDGETQLHAHTALSNCVLSMGKKLESLTLSHISRLSFDPTWLPEDLGTRLPKLRTLDLFIRIHDCDSWWRIMEEGRLKSFIGGLQSLSKLYLEFQACEHEDYDFIDELGGPYCVSFADILPSDMNGLSEFGTSHINATEESFIEFLLKHAETLTHIELDEVVFPFYPTWRKILYTMRDHLQLRNIRLRGEYLLEQIEFCEGKDNFWGVDEEPLEVDRLNWVQWGGWGSRWRTTGVNEHSGLISAAEDA